MLNEKELLPFLATATSALAEASANRDKYYQWWRDECEKTFTLNATIKTQHEEIAKLTEEVNRLRDAMPDIVPPEGLEASHEES